MRLPRAIAAVAAGLTLVAGGCSSSDPHGHNDADVTFATHMVQHHSQAIDMVGLTKGRKLDSDVARLADQVRAEQTPEIDEMTNWLKAWGEPLPATGRAEAAGGGMGGHVPGMMNAEQMTQLKQAPGVVFEQMWLAMMIAHHKGAIEMAQTEVQDGQNAKAIALAKDIISAQQREVSTMQDLLKG